MDPTRGLRNSHGPQLHWERLCTNIFTISFKTSFSQHFWLMPWFPILNFFAFPVKLYMLFQEFHDYRLIENNKILTLFGILLKQIQMIQD